MRVGSGSKRVVLMSSMERSGADGVGFEFSVYNEQISVEVRYGSDSWITTTSISKGAKSEEKTSILDMHLHVLVEL